MKKQAIVQKRLDRPPKKCQCPPPHEMEDVKPAKNTKDVLNQNGRNSLTGQRIKQRRLAGNTSPAKSLSKSLALTVRLLCH